MNDFNAFLEKCETLIREGRGREATRELMRVKGLAAIPRSERLGYANLCRRTGLIAKGLRALHPIVHPQWAQGEPAKVHELAEYAALLQRAGATPEALFMLQTLDPKTTPQVLLFQAFCHFNHWDYEAAEPCLRAYLKLGLGPYERLVGQVNLASAVLVNGRLAEAIDLLNTLIEISLGEKSIRVAANCLEMRAQARLIGGEFARAKEDLGAAESLLKSESAQDIQFVHKWNAVGEALEKGELGKLLAYRARNVRGRIWENVREADLYLLRAKFNRPRFDHLYFGTPFAGYRARILKTLSQGAPAFHYLYGKKGGPVFDLASGAVDGGSRVKPGQKIHQALRLIVSDFYRPYSAAGLFSELYPGEFFNVDTSPNRVRRLLGRTVDFFHAQNLPVSIHQRGGRFHLDLMGPVQFRVPRETRARETNDLHFEKLASHFGTGEWFLGRDIRLRLEMSSSGFKRFVGWAIAHGKLERSGATHATYYRLAKTERAA